MADISNSQLIPITLIHGSKKHLVSIGTNNPAGLPTLHNLKVEAERVTGIPPSSQRVIFKGKTLNDPGQMLCEVGIEPQSRIMILGHKPQDDPASQPVLVILQRVNSAADRLKSLDEEVRGAANGYLPQSVRADALKQHLRQCNGIGEELMKELESLDAMSIDASHEVARSKKKSTVRHIQAILDKVDSLSADISSLRKSES